MKNLENKLLKNKKILVTGGTGSIGKALVKKLLEYQPRVIRVFDINETELFEMEEELKISHPSIIKKDQVRFLIGDVRDKERVMRAMERVDVVFHLAGLKHVALCEYNPFEAVKTNVVGTQNVIDASLEHDVERVIFTSTDKAVYPHNVMGATKLLAERLVMSANGYRGNKRTIFSSVRFGNVIGTRGSVVPLFLKQIQQNSFITITDPLMTRFMMSRKQAVNLILKCACLAKRGETFILKMPVIKIGDLASVILESKKDIKVKVIGLKAGETLYEELMTENEVNNSIETKDMFIITQEPQRKGGHSYCSKSIKPVSKQEIKKLLEEKNGSSNNTL